MMRGKKAVFRRQRGSVCRYPERKDRVFRRQTERRRAEEGDIPHGHSPFAERPLGGPIRVSAFGSDTKELASRAVFADGNIVSPRVYDEKLWFLSVEILKCEAVCKLYCIDPEV